jgi:hypothetical protein
MLDFSWFEFIVRGIPEEFLFVLAVHVFSKTKIDLKKYLLSSTLFWIVVCLIRLLPIQFGINTMLNLVALIVLVSLINKIEIIKSIQAGIIVIILGFIAEGVNAAFVQFILKVDMNLLFNDPLLRTLRTIYGLPSLLFFGIFVIAYYLILSRRKQLNHV